MSDQRDYREQPLEVLSFGGGTQSSAMLLMIEKGMLPKPDLVLFADTGSELPETIEHIKTVAKPYVENVLQIPFGICESHRGKLHEYYLEKDSIPMIGIRSCTESFKILPQRRYVRQIVGSGGGTVMARFWLGITTDEAKRKPAERDPRMPKWNDLWFPLLDHHPMSRQDCIDLNNDHDWHVVKSGCFCCPYQGTRTWQALKRDHPELFQLSVELEENKRAVRGGKMGLHQDKPLSTIDSLDLDQSTCDSGAGCFL